MQKKILVNYIHFLYAKSYPNFIEEIVTSVIPHYDEIACEASVMPEKLDSILAEKVDIFFKDRLFYVINEIQPSLANKITGMAIENSLCDVIELINDRKMTLAYVIQAICVLGCCK